MPRWNTRQPATARMAHPSRSATAAPTWQIMWVRRTPDAGGNVAARDAPSRWRWTSALQQGREQPRRGVAQPLEDWVPPVPGRLERVAVPEVPLERRLQLLREPRVVDHGVELVVDAEAADVEVGRADRADLAIDAQRLGMQVSLPVQVHPRPRGRDLGQVGVGGPVRRLVQSLAAVTYHHLDRDASQSRRPDRLRD